MHFAEEFRLDSVLVDGSGREAVPEFDTFSGGDRGDKFRVLQNIYMYSDDFEVTSFIITSIYA